MALLCGAAFSWVRPGVKLDESDFDRQLQNADLASSTYYYLLVDYWLIKRLHAQTEPHLKFADRLHHR